MLSPKRTKYRKAHKGRIHGNAKGGTQLNFGAYGLKALTPARVTARQIEAADALSHGIFDEQVEFGSAFSQTSLFPASQPRLEWGRVKAHQSFGCAVLSRANNV